MIKALAVLRRFRVLIISVLCTIAALTTAFLISQGAVYGETALPESFTYGESISYTAKGLFTSVEYEYRAEGSSEWSAEKPANVGKYYVRAVTKGSFNRKRYGEEQAFTILPNTLRVYADGDSLQYGTIPNAAADGLMYEDQVSCEYYSFGDTAKESTEITPDASSVRVVNAKGEDVTASYLIEVVTKDIRLSKRPLTITVASATMEYNGQALTSDVYECAEGTPLASGDVLFTQFTCSQTEVGEVLNDPTLRIVNAKGDDVTHQYDVKKVLGTLKVEKRLLVITTEGGEFVYDGTAHKNENYTVNDPNALLPGHTETLVTSASASIIDVGEKENSLLFDVLDAEGNSVGDRYYRVQISKGILKVKKRTLVVETGGESWVYDAQTHSDTSYKVQEECDGVAEGQRLVILNAPTLFNVGSVQNNGTVQILDASDTDVTANYDITHVYGTISVTKRPITLVSGSNEPRFYDATVLEFAEYEITEGSLAEGVSHRLELEFVTLTDAGSIENSFTAIVRDAKGEDVSANYEITYQFGQLTINKRPITVKPIDAREVYNGLPLTQTSEFEITEGADQGAVAGHTVVPTIEGSQTTVGTSVNRLVAIQVLDPDGKDVTANYEPTLLDGVLEVTKRPITVKAKDANKTYDGTPLTAGYDESFMEFGEDVGLLSDDPFGHRIEIVEQSSITDYSADGVSNVLVVKILDKNGDPVTDNYEIESLPGLLTISKRNVKITAGSATDVYKDAPLTSNDYTVEERNEDRGLLKDLGHAITHIELIGAQVEVGESSNGVGTVVIMAGDVDVTENYNIEREAGALTVTVRDVTVQAAEDEKTYDGTALTADYESFTAEGVGIGLITSRGHYLKIVEQSSIIDFVEGGVANVIKVEIWTEDGRDVTKNYNISYIEGRLTILKREITVTTKSDEKTYDGTALTAGYKGYTKQEGIVGLLEEIFGHTLKIVDQSSITDFVEGGIANELTVEIWSADGKNVTDNYAIAYECGRLTILKREITVVADSAWKTYDGTPLQADYERYTEQEGIVGLLEGDPFKHYLKIVEQSSITDFVEGGIPNVIQVEIWTEDGKNVTDNYAITYVNGLLEIKKRAITVTTKSDKKTYDGTELTADIESYTEQEGDVGLLEEIFGHELKIVGRTSITDFVAGGVANMLTVEIWSADGKNVTDNYAIAYKYGTLLIEKRHVLVTAEDAHKIYDDTPLTGSEYKEENREGDRGLLKDLGHQIVDPLFDGSQTDVGDSPVVIRDGSVKILDKDGRDITFNYFVELAPGTLYVEPRPITVQAADDKKTYDGTALTAGYKSFTAEGVGMGLITSRGHYLKIVEQSSIIDFVEGGVANVIKVEIWTEDGRNVTGNYDITCLEGRLTILKREITVTTKSDKKTYDGTALTADIESYTEQEGDVGLLEEIFGHKLKIVWQSSIIDFVEGGIANELTVEIWSADGKNVTDNYAIAYEYGRLTILKRAITVTTATAEKPYDGTALKAGFEDETPDGLLTNLGHSLHIVNQASLIDFVEGGIENVIEVDILDKDGNSVYNNYAVSYVNGRLTILKREATITAETTEKVYDGTPLTGSGHEDEKQNGDRGLLNGHEIAEIEIVGSITNVWESPADNVITEGSIKIVDQNGKDVTGNYALKLISGVLTITKRELSITAGSDSKTYDDTPLTKQDGYDVEKQNGKRGLVTGQEITFVIEGSQTEVGSSDNVILLDSIKIMANGVDVTRNYEFDLHNGTLRVDPRKITVTAADASKTYDATPLTKNDGEKDFTNTAFGENVGLLPGHKITVVIEGSQTLVGSSANVLVSVKIVRESDGEDVTENYAVTKENGTLTVEKRHITIVADSNSKVYDDTKLEDSGFSAKQETGDKGLVSGQTVSAAQVIGYQLLVGSSENVVVPGTVVILDAEGDLATDNYDIHYENGTLTVTKRAITVTADSAEKTYDGTALTAGVSDRTEASENAGLVSGHTFKILDQSSIIDFVEGGVANHVEFEIWSLENGNVTDCYEIAYTDGLLKILKREATITAETTDKVYDGTPLTGSKHEDEAQNGDRGLLNGHEIAEIEILGSITNVWESPADNVITEGSIKIVDQNGKDVTGNYELKLISGVLTITKRELSITAGSDSKTYDDTPLTKQDGYEVEKQNGKRGLVTGQEITFVIEGSQTEVGSSDNVILLDSIKIMANGVDVTRNYEFDLHNGTLRVDKRPITVTAADASKTYDATPLTKNDGEKDFTNTAFGEKVGLLPGHKITVVIEGSQTLAGSSANVLVSVKIVRESDGEDVTKNYDVTKENGTLTVEKRAIDVTSGTKDKVYDGTPLSVGIVSYTEMNGEVGLLAGENLILVSQTTLTNVGNLVPNKIVVRIDNANGEDVTDCYKITYVFGTLTVTPRPLHVTSSSATKVYDGTVLSDPNYTVNEGEEEGVAPNQTLSVTIIGGILDVGKTANTIAEIKVTNEAGEDVTANYALTSTAGVLEVTPRYLTVVTGSASKLYDGTPLTMHAHIIRDGTLANDQSLYIEYTGTQTEVGSSSNTYSSYTVLGSGRDVTHNYVIRIEMGVLQVKATSDPIPGPNPDDPRPLVMVTTYAAKKLYDGLPLTAGYFVGQGPLEGHTLVVEMTGVQLEAGRSKNTATVTVLDGNGNDVTDEYQVVIDQGELFVYLAQITVKSQDESKTYDGDPLTGGRYDVTGDLLDDTHELRVLFTSSITLPGRVFNNFIARVYDADGNELDYYDIACIQGTLTVLPIAQLVVETASDAKYYDGTPLTNDGFALIDGELMEGYRLELVEVTGSQTEIGYSKNIMIIRVVDADGNEVPGYTIRYEYGYLEVFAVEAEEDDDEYQVGLPGIGEDDSDSEGRPVALIKSEQSGTVYLRRRSYGVYTGNSFRSAKTYTELIGGAYSMNYLAGLALQAAGYESIELQIADSSYFFLPNYLSTDAYTHLPQRSDTIALGSARKDYMLHYYAYDVQGNATLLASVPAEYAELELAYRAFVRANYLDIPEATLAYMQGIIAEQGFDTNDTFALIRAVASYIQNAAEYNMDYDRTLDDEADIAVAFLSEYKEGVCQHYATAATMLFRALGLPARYTVGHVVDAEAGEWTEVTSDRAHAWVEVYVNGIGWLNVEVTGGGPGGGIGGNGGNGGTGGTGGTVDIVIQTGDASKNWDGTPLTAQGYEILAGELKAGHSLQITYTGSQTDIGFSGNSAEVIIVDENGKNVTKQYKLQINEGVLRVKPRPVTVKGDDAEKIYDGTELKKDSYEVLAPDAEANTGLMPGHRVLSATVTGSQTNAGVGKNVVSHVVIVDAEGNDVTALYEVIAKAGSLTVKKREASLTAGDAEKVYDGTPLTNKSEITPEYAVTGGETGLLAGHVLVEGENDGSLTNAGTAQNDVRVSTVKILDANGDDVTGNYTFKSVSGTLTVKKRAITVTADSATKTYDGTKLTAGYKSFTKQEGDVGLLEGDPCKHSLKIVSQSSITDFVEGGEPNKLTVKIYDKDGFNVTSNYEITYVEGLLVIEKRLVTVTAGSATKIYDGDPLTFREITFESATADSNRGLLTELGHYIENYTIESSLTNAGVVSNKIVQGSVQVCRDYYWNDVTKNYKFELVDGKLTVEKRHVLLTASSATRVYNGTALVDHSISYERFDAATARGLLSWHTLSGLNSGSIVDVGTVTNAVILESVKVLGGTGGEDYTANYTFEQVNYGTLTVTKRHVLLTAGSATKIYDGTPLTCDKIITELAANGSDRGLLKEFGHAVEAMNLGTVTDVRNTPTPNRVFLASVKILYVDGEGNTVDVTKNYEIERADGELTVTKRSLTLTAGSKTWVYNDQEFSSGEIVAERFNASGSGIVTGQKVVGETVGSIINVGTVTNTVVSDSVKIMSDNVDVTHNYEITLKTGKLTVTKRPITVVAGTAEKTYDGTALTAGVFDRTQATMDAGMVAGHAFKILSQSSLTDFVEGGKVNHVKFEIRNKNGDVTGNYEITYSDGLLTILKRVVTVTASDAQKTYDGTPLTNTNVPTVEAAKGDRGLLIDLGHKIAEIAFEGSVTNVWDSPAVNSIKVGSIKIQYVDADEKTVDVTHNYEFELVDGKLTVTKRAVVLTAGSAKKVYDGTPLTNESEILAELATAGGKRGLLKALGHTAVGKNIGSITDAGTKSNVTDAETVKILDAHGEDISLNYEIKLAEGTLTVTKRHIIVTAGSATKIYDGTPLSCDKIIPELATEESARGLLEALGHVVEGMSIGSVTDVQNTPVANSVILASVKITYVDAEGNTVDVTKNYEIERADGELTVTPRPITITSNDAEKIYDGTPLVGSDAGFTYTKDGVDEGLLEKALGHIVEVVLDNSITNVGKILNTTKSGLTQSLEFKHHILDAQKNDVTKNYKVTIKLGMLTVTARPITVTANSAEKTYDGTELTAGYKSYTKDGVGEGLLEKAFGHQIKIVKQSSIINYVEGGIANKLEVEILDKDGKPVTSNYKIGYVDGLLTILKRVVTVTASTATKIYDGTPLTNTLAPTVEAAKGDRGLLIDLGHKIVEIEFEGSVTNVWDSPVANKIKLSSIKVQYLDAMGNPVDVTSNYEFDLVDGKLSVTKRALLLTADSAELVYNGREQSYHKIINEPFNLEGKRGLVELQEVIGENTGALKNVGTVTNAVDLETVCIMTLEGVDVTGNYAIETDDGTLTVTPRPITITSGDGEKIYDGTPLLGSQMGFTCTPEEKDMGLLESLNHTLSVLLNNSITNVGEAPNNTKSGLTQSFVFTHHIYDEQGVDVTLNYKVTAIVGKLTVLPRPITITSNDAEKVYDGTPLLGSEAGFSYTKEDLETGLLETEFGHKIELVLDASITNVGEIDNTVKGSIVIRDAEGNDVSANYSITVVEGKLTVLPATLILTAGSDAKKYDGTPLTNNTYTFDESGLLKGHVIDYQKVVVTMDPASTITDPGKVANKIANCVYVILDAEGNDVTGNYELVLMDGELEIYRVKIVIETGSDYKRYDGTPLTNGEWKVVEGAVAPGHQIIVTMTGSQTELGESDNTCEVIIVDGEGNPIEDRYEVEIVPGKLSVGVGNNPSASLPSDPSDEHRISRPSTEEVLVAMLKAEKSGTVYLRQMSYGSYTGQGFRPATPYTGMLDGAFSMNYLTGLALAVEGYDSYEMIVKPMGGTFFLPYYLSTDAYTHGQQPDDVAATKFGTGEYMLHYYAYTAQDGAILLTSVPAQYAEIEQAYRQFVYRNYTDIPASTLTYMKQIIEEQGFDARDHRIIKKVADFIKNSATYNLEYDGKLDQESDIAVAFLSEYKEGICQHYATAATMLFRALGIPARFTTGYMAGVTAGEWVEVSTPGHAWVEVYLDGFGWVNVEVTGGAGGVPQPPEEEETGSKTAIKVELESIVYSYNGKLREYFDDSYYPESVVLPAGYTFTLNLKGGIVDVGTIDLVAFAKTLEFRVEDADGNDVTDQYYLVLVGDPLEIVPREITITVDSEDRAYNGEALTPKSLTVTKGSLVKGHYFDMRRVEFIGELTAPGTVEASVESYSIVICDAQGRDVTHNYSFTIVSGTLTVY